jgi:RluA family pseudouridine synthase
MDVAPGIIYEDDDLVVVNKPSGMLTEGDKSGVEAWARGRFDNRARCCHRLDRATSGLILIRKNRRFNAELADLFARRLIKKTYWALVEGVWATGVNSINAPIARHPISLRQEVSPDGKPAKTTCRLRGLSPIQQVSWVELILKTGRTHQARVHCAHVGCPILGDQLYGAVNPSDLFGLHARELRFIHPGTKEPLVVTADPPAAWASLMDTMRPPK